MLFRTISSIPKRLLIALFLLLPCISHAQSDPTPTAPEQTVLEREEVPGGAVSAEENVDADGPQALTKANVDAWLDGFLPYALHEADLVGAVVSVVKDGNILTSRGFGYADLGNKVAMDPSTTLVRPGSISKLFTWTAIMQLVEQGKIDLDKDVNSYLDFKIPDAYNAPITVRHLMTHTAGFEEVMKDLIWRDGGEKGIPTLEHYVKNHVPARIFPPGKYPAYSNYATALAGYIVERVSGQSFDDYIDANIFARLDMNHSSFRQPLPEKLQSGMSKAYKSKSDGEAQYYEYIIAAPAGSMAATADDMARFMIAHLDNGGALLSPETALRMHTTLDPHFSPLNAMALGFYQQNHYGLRSIGHGGDTDFFHSDLCLFLDKGVGLFVSLNTNGEGADTHFLREELAIRFGLRYFPEDGPGEEKTLATARKHGEQVAGVYTTTRGAETNFAAALSLVSQLTIAVDEEGNLIMPFAGKTFRWREVAPYIWRNLDGPDRLTVKMVDGKVERMSFEPLSPIISYLPAVWYQSSAVLYPLIIFALVVLVLTVIAWPAGHLARWWYKQRFPLAGVEARAFRLARVGAMAALVYLIGWILIFNAIETDLTVLSGALDVPLRLLQIAQLVLYAALAAAVWEAFIIWTGWRGWWAQIWSVALALALLIVIWFAAVCGFLKFSLTY